MEAGRTENALSEIKSLGLDVIDLGPDPDYELIPL